MAHWKSGLNVCVVNLITLSANFFSAHEQNYLWYSIGLFIINAVTERVGGKWLRNYIIIVKNHETDEEEEEEKNVSRIF